MLKKPVVSLVNLERGAILTPLENIALLVEFGATDKVLAELLFGEKQPMGQLPIEFRVVKLLLKNKWKMYPMILKTRSTLWTWLKLP